MMIITTTNERKQPFENGYNVVSMNEKKVNV